MARGRRSQLTGHSSQVTAHSSRLTAHSSQLTAHSSRLTVHNSKAGRSESLEAWAVVHDRRQRNEPHMLHHTRPLRPARSPQRFLIVATKDFVTDAQIVTPSIANSDQLVPVEPGRPRDWPGAFGELQPPGPPHRRMAFRPAPDEGCE
jgi:hypothetical protein